MKTSSVLLVVPCLLLVLSACPFPEGGTGTSMIIDHRCVDLSAVPVEYIETAVAGGVFHYGHRSHGSQPLVGAEAVAAESGDDKYAIQAEWCGIPAASGVLRVWDGMLSDNYVYPEMYWQGGGADALRDLLSANPSIKYTMWSWCGEMDDWSLAQVDEYLSALSALEAEFPDVVFVYMTGHAMSSWCADVRSRNNARIREYCIANGKVLFDFEDLDVWYGASAGSCTVSGKSYGLINDAYMEGTVSVDTHVNALCSLNKGRAFWWMMARLAGWDGR